MMALRTAHFKHAVSDVGVSDQGDSIDSNFIYFCISHPPWVSFGKALSGELKGLRVPDDIVEDWNRQIPDKPIPQVWEEIDYEKRYKRHLKFDPQAKKDLEKVEMLDGEKDICIVCTCSSQMYKYCPRRVVYEYYQNNIA